MYGKVAQPKRAPGTLEPDVVLMKSDGTPTYHMANVVDDHDMNITHVIRGTEWMPSTPIHIDLYNAFGWTPPHFGHVGLLTNEDGSKLSKRRSDTDIATLRDQEAVLPETLVNFLALLGWSHQEKSDVMSLPELTEKFTLKFTKGNTVVTMEKLWYLQKHHAARRIAKARVGDSIPAFLELVNSIVPIVEESFHRPEYERIMEYRNLKDYVASVLMADDKSYQQPGTWVERNSYFFTYEESAAPWDPQTLYAEEIKGQDVKDMVQDLFTSYLKAGDFALQSSFDETPQEQWQMLSTASDRIGLGIKEACSKHAQMESHTDDEAVTRKRTKEWSKAVHVYLRERLAYGQPGPHVGQIMAILGSRECERRLGLSDGDSSDVIYVD